ncbi:hypothetical protein [Leptolyngbya sp. 'hensonii']|uniref:hypothetical protein n=1 Tax=Leptolyngbya sp. 'hensonii' TaxID=1922337 RepID=UPI000AE89021|nr:hypothetical protein [Leptolyngbya sp. 'hensonii']
MVVLKLLGHALGTVVMYWGLVLLLLAPWLLVLLLVLLTNQIWNRVTGREEEWTWFFDWTEAIMQRIHQIKFEWIGWLPGMAIQTWYAGHAAHLVQTASAGVAIEMAIALNLAGVLGMVLASVISYWLYTQVVQVSLGRWVYGLVGGLSLSAYFVLLQQPEMALRLSQGWTRVFTAVLAAFIESLLQ